MTTTTVRNWLDIVREADPDFDYERRFPIAYEFAAGKVTKREDTATAGPYEED